MFRFFLILVGPCLFLASCKEEVAVLKIQGKRIEVNDSLEAQRSISEFIEPYKKHVDSSLNAVLCYAPETYSKSDGELNTAIGNMMAEAVFEQGNPIFKSRSGKEIDFVLLNYGGIRSVIPKGHVTSRTAYEVMPFENEVVVAGLKGTVVNDLIKYLQKAKRAHPISSQLQIKLSPSYELLEATIHKEPIQKDRTYYVATNDYLFHGGDRMTFFENNNFHMDLDYKIRNVLLDYFSKQDTLKLASDQRFTIKTP
jgi:2',3'-cyclic-nucleotide 2'-phosphodiesterase (5'-nucleotidase family)